MSNIFYIIILVCSSQLAISQNTSLNIAFSDSNWTFPKDAQFETFDGRKTLILKGGRATVKNLQFTNGSISVDVYANSKRSFAGITFRKQDNNMEEVYMRMHKSNQVDAVQYTPIYNNESNWQLYNKYQAKVALKNEGWNRMRIDIHHNSAEVYVNDNKALTIDDLKTDQIQGNVGLFALFSNRFSNFSITHADVISDSTNTSIKKNNDSTIIKQWNITEAQPYIAETFDITQIAEQKHFTVPTEASGLLAISKYVIKSSSGQFEQNNEEYIVATTNIYSPTAETKLFSFDFSDKIIVYLNEQVLFRADNSFRAKGVQYMGHVGAFVNQLYLPLQKGNNTIQCVVIDKANGWGLMAKLE